jgi:glycosyltransferase involved in cell wall biosynthesis
LNKQPGFQWCLRGQLRELYRRWHPDVVHTHNLGTLIYAALAGLGMRRRPALLHGEHAQLAEEEKGGKRFWQRRCFYRLTDGIHVVSHGMREDFKEAGFAVDDWDVVVNGVDVERFVPQGTGESEGARVRDELGLGPGEIVLGLVGRYGPYKGHLRLLKAFEKVSADRPDLRLMFVGDGGPMREEVTKALASSPAKDRVIHAGYQAEMKGYYQALDLLVVASVNEGLSNAVLEAMSCGVPTLAHPACGNADVLEDGQEGYLRDLSGEDALRDALLEALQDQEDWTRLGAGGRARAVREFGIESMAAGYLEVYRRLAQKDAASEELSGEEGS